MFAEMPLDNRTVNKFAALAAIAGFLRPLATSPRTKRLNSFVAADSFVTLNPRYVNMADINFSEPLRPRPIRRAPRARHRPRRPANLRWDIIELLFFAYRDFVGDADHELEAFGFGRAHHRVLHFVHRYPGLKVADLLDVLRITKQSLGRVLKQLLDEGYIVQKTGNNDRRQRLLYATPKGEALVAKLAGPADRPDQPRAGEHRPR